MIKKVLVGMSGGVDSSVAAAMLVEEGYDVVGITLKLYDYADLDFEPPDGGCCSIDLINDARSVCAILDIPHYVVDMRQSFETNVIENFIDAYSRGRTPNPCINCNRFIKWGEMMKTGEKLGCDFVATGHYARIQRCRENIQLLKAVDDNKDQSYALWGIPSAALSRTLLPIGEFTKSEIRDKAKALGFRNADRADSQDICFVPSGDYAHIFDRRRGTDDAALKSGPIFDIEGKKIGEHNGYAHFTIGQRRGFGISSAAPLYVSRINPDQRSITVAPEQYLYSRRFTAIDANWLIDPHSLPPVIHAKIRYRHEGSPACLTFDGETVIVTFDDPQRAITPGQSAVFYDADCLLGGAIIDKVLD